MGCPAARERSRRLGRIIYRSCNILEAKLHPFSMTTPPLDLHLTHGQVAWTLARGLPPSRELLDQLRYLRQLGVPFAKNELGGGRGHRIWYGFDQLIELGVAVFGLRRGMAPREMAGMLVNHRAEFRRCFRDVVVELPAGAFEADWVKSRGAIVR